MLSAYEPRPWSEFRSEVVQRESRHGGVAFLSKRLQSDALEVRRDVMFSAYHSCFEGSDIRILADFD